MSVNLLLTPWTMEASVASLVVRAPGLFNGSSNQPISCLNMAWKPIFLRRRVRRSPDLAKANPWDIKPVSRVSLKLNHFHFLSDHYTYLLKMLMQTCKNCEKKLIAATRQNRTHIPLICSVCSCKSPMAKVCKHNVNH